ncbi:peptidyl-prolyl cis-trans isomerase [Winogradskyella psychrotolerans]|uniref:peptidylprolyl isomerase n=1 Tax=Winogradskyella psychrotolerans TaxID=1344585 RepID=UPI001C07B6CD|nr:peptidylprolyl isomerase [Winogradskyella psychrotolerans]MBU2921277.1 peptidyl-prolyl cis-trans isomerase [Winogradskyella psychrotolerans]
MKHLFTLLLLIPFLGFSQIALEQQLDSISTSDEATTFLKKNKPKQGKLFTFNKEKHKTRLANDLFNLSKGGKKVIRTDFKKTYYKVIDKAEIDYLKFSIIVIDASKMSAEEAIKKRNKVIAQYKEGYRFKDLAKHHSTDHTAKKGGDTGWIKAGEMPAAFDQVAFGKNHAIDEIFSIDDIENQKYYLAIKTEDRTAIEEITVLKFSEDID